MPNDNQKKDVYHKRLVSCCRAVITGQESFAFACKRLYGLIHWLEDEAIQSAEFNEFMNSIMDVPIGTCRLQCETEYLIRKETELQEVISKYKPEIYRFCMSIIEKYG